MAYSREDFVQAIAAEISNHPLAAQYYQAGDPRLLAQLGAMATMLSMLSQQIDVESMEPFVMSRDTTVLADATMKGILPFARPARVTLSIENASDETLTLAIGRRLLDQQGRLFITETAAAINAGNTGTVTAKQMTMRQIAHTVANTVPFYSVQIPVSTDETQIISGVLVSIAGTMHPYSPEFANVAPGAPGFTIETDEYRRIFAKFGWQDVFGIQPKNGDVIDFVVEECAGKLDLPVGAQFTFETAFTAADRNAKVTLASVIFPGANPVDVQTMREWAQYPSTYDNSAVYLGNFDFLVRRNVAPLRFLSIWNEQIEEAARGASVDNINRLFIAALMDGATTVWLHDEIAKVIRAADDSYRLTFVTPVEDELSLTVNAQVSVVHDPAEVTSKIKEVLLSLYGRDAPAVRRGMLRLNHKRIYDELRKNIPALQSDGSDFQVIIPAPPETVAPEDYRYISLASITVNVTKSTYNDGLWSH